MKPTPIRDLIKINPRFLRSAQLERDFSDPAALDGYIVTPEVQGYLRSLGRGLNPNSGERAWRITGDYGSGKSSFALLLANLMGRKPSDLPKPLRYLRGDLGLAREATPFLPILVTGSREPMAYAIIRSLHEALESGIDGRKKLECRRVLAEIVSVSQGCTDKRAIAAISGAAKELVEKGIFGGLLIILDELGKFLEFSARHPEKQDVYFLQQLAETSSRSNSCPVLTISLLHQGFSAYAGRLSDTTQREWDKVGGRFGSLSFSQPLTQVATLLATALCVRHSEELWGWKKRAKEDMAEAIELGMFGPSVGKTALSELAPDLYPIHPTVLPVLNRFFRRFGQNERSLFSFLLSSEPHALPDFASRPASALNVYRLSDFYDFAAENFAHRLSAQSFRSHWHQIDAVIRSHPEQDGLDIQILKTVGILNVIESQELLPTRELLSLALGHPDDLDERLRELSQKRHVLFNRGIRRGYSLWPNTSVNLEQAFINASEHVSSIPPLAEIVRQRLDSRPIVARRHYISTGTLRHFSVHFLTVNELSKSGADLDPVYPADGTVAVVLCEKDDDRSRAEEMVGRLKTHRQVVLAISPPLEGLQGHVLELEWWQWVQHHTMELKDDRFAATEVAGQISAISGMIENWIQQQINFRSTGSDAESRIRWFYKGSAVESLNQGGSLQSFLSALCVDKLFPKAPLVHNELVNRHSISSSAAAARQKLFKAMLESAELPLLGLPDDKAPPEKSMYLSVFLEGRLHREDAGSWKIALPESGKHSDPCHLRPTLDAIIHRLEEKPDARVNVGDLYTLLRSPAYGVRDGLIPILLLTVFIVHETEIAIYEDGVFQPQIEEFLLMRLARAPQTFEFQLCRINGVRRDLISQLASVIQSDQADKTKLLSIVRPLCLFVAEQPDYVRNTDNLRPETLALRKAIETAREPAELVFHAIPKALGFSPKVNKEIDAAKLAKKLGESLVELRRCFPELQSRMSAAILDAFDSNASLETWRASTALQAETVLIGLTDPDLRAFCLKLLDDSMPEPEWLEALGSFLTRCPPSRWKDRDELAFCERVRALAGQFQRVLATCFDKDGSLPDSAIRVAVTPRNGEEKDMVLRLTPAQAKEAATLKRAVRDILPATHQISLAALSQVLWDLLKDTK